VTRSRWRRPLFWTLNLVVIATWLALMLGLASVVLHLLGRGDVLLGMVAILPLVIVLAATGSYLRLPIRDKKSGA
jgi:ABC-type sugar transport system permease subunit